MTAQRFTRIGVVANLTKSKVLPLLETFIPDLQSAGFAVRIEPLLESSFDGSYEVGIDDACDLIIAVGGDGTILRAAREYLDLAIPILGINAGRVGFLTENLSDDIITRIKEGRFDIQKRMRIQVSIRGGDSNDRFTALNDIVIHGSGYSRMVTLRTSVDGTFMREYAADGLIMATATGSTAYSLSAGGPLLAPTIQSILLTPLCPHTLSDRPIVLAADETVTVRVVSHDSDIRVTVDGQLGHDLQDGEHVVVKKSDTVTRLLVPEGYDFFALLRDKL